jgi:hypothetical protein
MQLQEMLKKQRYSSISVADQLEQAKKNGASRSLIDFLQAERNAEIAAEAAQAARIRELETVLQEDAVAAEKLRIQGILSLAESDPSEQRLLSYCEKLSDKPAMHSASAEEWRVLVLSILPNVSILFAGQNIAPLTQEELEKFILPYMVTNGIFVGDPEAYLIVFKSLNRRGVIRVPVPVVVPVETREPSQAERVQAEIDRLTAKARSHPFDSRERNQLERQAMQLETRLELLGSDLVNTTLAEIVEGTGKAVSADHQMQWLNWARLPAQLIRFDINTRRGLRLSFAIFFGCAEESGGVLSADEISELNHNRQVESLSARDIKAAVGSFTDFGPRSHAGIRQGGR